MKNSGYINSIIRELENSGFFLEMPEDRRSALFDELRDLICKIDNASGIEDAYFTLNSFFQEGKITGVYNEHIRRLLIKSVKYLNSYSSMLGEANRDTTNEAIYLNVVDGITYEMKMERSHSISFLKALKSLIDHMEYDSSLSESVLRIERFIRDAMPSKEDAQNACLIVQNIIIANRNSSRNPPEEELDWWET